MSSAALSSIRANVRGGTAVLLHPLQSATSWIRILVHVCSLSVEAVIDSRHRGPSHWLSNYQATWGTSKTAHGVRYRLSVFLHILHCVRFCPCLKPSQEASSVSSASPPLVLLLLPHMLSGRRPAAFVDALTDGNRNSSTNRPILWLTGEQ
ncbi:hypothetical protein VZT92_024574 [Zoarces viviparus]|uniref:Secreted protein n=1 Tax=Zoarces viviparus TaxID=48416 RepID=A0AAW1E356_ZOAVI